MSRSPHSALPIKGNGLEWKERGGDQSLLSSALLPSEVPLTRPVQSSPFLSTHSLSLRHLLRPILDLILPSASHHTTGYGSAFGEKYGNADRVEVACAALVRHGYSYIGKVNRAAPGALIRCFVLWCAVQLCAVLTLMRAECILHSLHSTRHLQPHTPRTSTPPVYQGSPCRHTFSRDQFSTKN
jgi:hypothetical protein